MLERATSKAGWTSVRFDQIATQINDRVDNPAEAGVERYVGLEHLDPESLRIRRWGEPTDVESTKLRFQPGDIIFGKRRVYQRKVAVADFEGICSAHALVLRVKPGPALPELLPFFMQSDLFMERALSISVGSLSPTINWKALASEEFLLPPIQEQARLVEAIQAAGAMSDAMYNLERQLRQLQLSMLKDKFRPGEKKQNLILNDVLDRVIDYRGKPPPKSSSGVPLLTAKNIRDGYIDKEPQEFIPETKFDSWMRRGLPQTGDVLFTTEAPLGNVARVPTYKFALGQRSITLRANTSRIYPDYLYWLLRSPTTRNNIFARASGTTALGIKQSLLRTIPVFVPDLREQLRVCSALNDVEARLNQEMHRRLSFSSIYRKLINEVGA